MMMKHFLIIITLLTSVPAFADVIQTCEDLGNMSGEYSLVEDPEAVVKDSDIVDTILTMQSDMKYIQEDIIDAESEVFNITLTNTGRGCEIKDEGVIIQKLDNGNLMYLAESFMTFLAKH
jgi:hypothetical protein